MPMNNKSPAGYLLYCIYRCGEAGPVLGLTGVQAHRVETISAHGLCAAVSPLHDATPVPRVLELNRYSRVVAACHQNHPTIPMRYGSTFRDERAIVRHLETNRHDYQALLMKLTDCEEMGIRLLVPATEAALPLDGKPSGKGVENRTAVGTPLFSGKDYLARQKHRYGLADDFIRRAETRLLAWRESFSGLFTQCLWERPQKLTGQKAPILSIYFLVPRRHLPGFRQTFIRISRQRPEKALLSGPWPPYNFVRQERSETNLHDAATCCPDC